MRRFFGVYAPFSALHMRTMYNYVLNMYGAFCEVGGTGGSIFRALILFPSFVYCIVCTFPCSLPSNQKHFFWHFQ